MRWKGRRQSDNFEDVGKGGGGGRTVVGGGIGVLIVAAIVYFMGGDPSQILQQAGNTVPTQNEAAVEDSPERKESKEFVRVVLGDTEDVWNKLFAQMGQQYKEPKLIVFTDEVQSACGMAGAATGPFYCSADDQVYIDLSFYDVLKNKLNSPGDFAMAYVIAHEVGHHVQHLMGITDKVHAMRSRLSEAEYNKLSVKLELQADFFAGVWAHHAQQMNNILEAGDIEEALNAAHEIGDDRLQQRSSGRVVPDAFTHGTSAQRMHWFKKGFETGDISQGNTFEAADL
ncbi:metalloprotease [Chitinophagaceae bacterium IBVUCB1]|nr:metalloprotease [Chitinophagaceae bacterium IBVUCB1]